MKNYNLHFIRHGLTTATAEGTVAGGGTDCQLSRQGIKELIDLKECYDYPPVELLYLSPMTRCVQTGGIIYPDSGAIIVEGLKERDLGCFEGKSLEELKKQEDFRAWLADSRKVTPEGGENMNDFASRALDAVAAVIEDMIKSDTTDAAIITDGGVIMTALAALAYPRLPIERWICGAGRGFTCFVDVGLWHRGQVFEAAGIAPHGLDSAI